VVEYAKKAHQANPSDPKIKDFYTQVSKEYRDLSGNSNESNIEEEKKESDEPTIIEEQKSYAYTPSSSPYPIP